MKKQPVPTVNTIQWETWKPTEYAVLCFIRYEQSIMLIRKKRGLGAGKINGPGGRIEPGETAIEAAIRETQEEIGLTPHSPQEMGQLFFEFTDGYLLHGRIFCSQGYTGNPIETDEAIPFWCDESQIPYHDMWADDQYWLPWVLKNKYIKGYFTFDNDTMLSRKVEIFNR